MWTSPGRERLLNKEKGEGKPVRTGIEKCSVLSKSAGSSVGSSNPGVQLLGQKPCNHSQGPACADTHHLRTGQPAFQGPAPAGGAGHCCCPCEGALGGEAASYPGSSARERRGGKGKEKPLLALPCRSCTAAFPLVLSPVQPHSLRWAFWSLFHPGDGEPSETSGLPWRSVLCHTHT